MNGTGRLRGQRSHGNGPGPDFLFAGREIGLQSKELVSRQEQTFHPALANSRIAQKFLPVFKGLQLSYFGFQGCANHQNLRAFGSCHGTNLLDHGVVGGQVLGRHIANVENRLGCQQKHVMEQFELFGGETVRPHRFSPFQTGFDLDQNIQERFGVFVPGLGRPFGPGLPFFDGVQILELQLRINDFFVR